MPPTKEIKPSPSPDKLAVLRTRVAERLDKEIFNPEDAKGFLMDFGLLVKDKKQLGRGERRDVDVLVGRVKGWSAFVLMLGGELTEVAKDVSNHPEVIDLYKAAASALGLSKEFKQALAEQTMVPDSPGRRRFIGGALKVGGVAAVLAATGGSGALIGAAYQGIKDAGDISVRAPGLPRPKVPGIINTQPEASPPPAPPLAGPAGRPSPEASPPPPTPTPEKPKTPEAKAPEINKMPPKEERIFYPPELSYGEVRPLIDKLRNTHDAVLTESLFTQELSSLPPTQREKVLDAIAQAHAQALYEYYGDTDAIIGLDPGHGGSDVGSGATGRDGKSLAEKDLTWLITNATAEKLYELSKGKYRIVVLRPENPHDEDLDGDGRISNVERLQKRKAMLVKAEEYFRPNPADRGRNIVYCSIHLNGSPDGNQRGTEVFWPNKTATESDIYRDSSRQLALILQRRIFESIREVGLATLDRGAKEDPDSRPPGPNSDTLVGPYVALGSPKLKRILLQA